MKKHRYAWIITAVILLAAAIIPLWGVYASAEGEEHFLLTFAGDCTLGTDTGTYGYRYSFIDLIGEDYDYPFRNVVEFFEEDDFTMVNLEGVLADTGTPINNTFTFHGPKAYVNILTGSSVEAVTLANNHTGDFGLSGSNSTREVLDEAGVTYVERDTCTVFTTESGLKIGIYGMFMVEDRKDLREKVARMRADGAEVIVLAVHWGVEGSYRPYYEQTVQAKEWIDCGVDIVYGHHPHVLQKIEIYGDRPIFYSLGNFSFGGNHWPSDLDSAIVQQEVIRSADGAIRMGELRIIPVCISSLTTGQNNFQPTPYEEGSDGYNRVLKKLEAESYPGQ